MFSYSLLVRSGIAILLWSQVSIGQDNGFSDSPTGEITCTTLADDLENRNTMFRSGDSTLKVYPGLKFNCNGRITGVRLFGCRSTPTPSPNNPGLDLQLWGQASSSSDELCHQSTYNLQYSVTPSMNTNRRAITVRVPPNGISVRAGNVLGIKHQHLTLLYWNGDSDPYIPNEERKCIQADLNDDNRNYPLISIQFECDSVEVCDANCTSGFLPSSSHKVTPKYSTTDVPSLQPHPTPTTSTEPPTDSATSTEPPTDSEPPDDRSMQPTVQSPSSPPPAAQGGVPVVALAGAGVGVAVVGLLVIVVAVLVCILCRKRRKLQQATSNGPPQNNIPGNNPVYHGKDVGGISNITACDNAAYGMSKKEMEMSSYNATKSTRFTGEDEYDYIPTTDENDIITTSPNEDYATTDNVPVSNNQAYGMVQH